MAVPIPLFVPLEQEILAQIKKNINLSKGLKEHKKSLESGFTRLEARIDDILVLWKGEPGNATSRKDVAEMRALAQEIADCLELYVIRPRHKNVLSKKSFAKKMEKLDGSLKKLLAEKKPPEAGEQVESPLPFHCVEQTPKGVATATKKLLELLDRTGREPEKLKAIAIVGFSGSGKTTLANEAFKRTSKDGDQGFPLRAWINSAEYGSETVLLRKIIQKFWPDAVEETGQLSPWELIPHIKNKLQGQRYLIVFDDLNDEEHWKCISTIFDANSRASSRIIVTTRLRSMAYHCRAHGDGYLYEMRALGDKASKDITGLRDYQHTEELLEKCGGHPLALCSVKDYFRSINGPRDGHCKALCNSLGKLLHDAKEDETRDFTRLRGVLMDSLVSLTDSTARCCLLYLGIFPNGRPIKWSRATRRWVAEGFAAEDSFKKFIGRNIVQPVGITRKSNDKSKLCKTLSILHEFVLHMSISQDFILAIQDQEEYRTTSTSKKGEEKKKVRHIFVNASGTTSTGSTDLKCVRSLTVSKEAGLGGAFSQFSKYELLRVLDMEECCDVNDTHLNDICKNLRNLRYLSLGTNITKLPDQFVKNLKLLECLHLSKEEVSELPVQVIGMTRLKHLIGKVKFLYKNAKDALDLSVNSNLETIAGAITSGEEKGFLVDMMPKMKELKKVKIWCTSNGDIKMLDTQLFQAIKWYTECDKQRSLCVDFNGLSQDDMDKLQNRGLHYKFFEETTSTESYLSCLKLHGTLLSSIPKFLAKLLGLAMLCLSLTTLTQEHLTRLSEVKALVHLKLIAGHIDPLEIPTQVFLNLESLCFKVTGSSAAANLKINIIEPTVLESGETVSALPKLVSLQLLCEELPDPSGIQITHIRKLQEIELDHKFKGDARKPWEEAAWSHPNRPNVLPLESLDDPDAGTSTEEQAAPSVTNVDAGAAREGSADDSGGERLPAQERLSKNESILTITSKLAKKAVSKLGNRFMEKVRRSGEVPGQAQSNV